MSVAFHRMGHVALRVGDLEKSVSFYQQLFGVKRVWMAEGEIAFLECGGDDLALIQIPKEKRLTPEALGTTPRGLDHFGFRVRRKEDVDSAYRAMKAQGVEITFGPKLHRDGAYSFYISDPDGNSVQILWDPSKP